MVSQVKGHLGSSEPLRPTQVDSSSCVGHSHGDEAKKTDSQEDGSASNTALDHDGHAHARADEAAPKKSRFTDLNILGILIHILGDALNSIAVSE